MFANFSPSVVIKAHNVKKENQAFKPRILTLHLDKHFVIKYLPTQYDFVIYGHFVAVRVAIVSQRRR